MSYSDTINIDPTTSGDLTTYRGVAAATTNAASIVTGAHQVYGGRATNTHATSWRYIKLYDKASSPTVGTDVPKQVWGIPPGSGFIIPVSLGLHSYTLGVSIAIVESAADSGTTAVSAANEVVWEVWIK